MSGRPLEGYVDSITPNGANVDLGGLWAFVPTKLLLLHGETLDMLQGKVIKGLIIKVSAVSANILMSRVELYQEEDLRMRTQAYESLSTETIYQGTVRSVMQYGVFVEIGNLCGMIPLKELSWDFVDDPAELVREGQTIDVKVLETDVLEKKIVLSHRETIPNPWHSMSRDVIQQGAILDCEVKGLWKTGIFVKLPEGICGIVKNEAMPGGIIPQDIHEGDTIKVRIEELDYENEVFRLGLVDE